MSIHQQGIALADARSRSRTTAKLVRTIIVLTAVASLAPGVLSPGTPASAAVVACEEVQQQGPWTMIYDIPGWWYEQFSGESGRPNYSDGAWDEEWGIAEWRVHPTDPNVIYVVVPEKGHEDETNPGILEGSLLRSRDGGCSWQEVLTDDELNPPVAPGGGTYEDKFSPRRIESIGVAADGTVYAAIFVRHTVDTSRLESVWVSRDAGENWDRITDGLPVTATPDAPETSATMVAARRRPKFFPSLSDPHTMYMLTGVGGTYTDLYATTNGGRSWEARIISKEPALNPYVDDCVLLPDGPAGGEQGPCTDSSAVGQYYPPEQGMFAVYDSLVVDPLDSRELWAWRYVDTEAERDERRRSGDVAWRDVPPSLYHSTDGGAKWDRISIKGYDPPRANFGGPALRVVHAPGGPPTVFVAVNRDMVPIPEDQQLMFCPEERTRYLIVSSTDYGNTWQVFARVEGQLDIVAKSPPFMGFGSGVQNAVMGWDGNAVYDGCDMRMYRYERRSDSWLDVSPDHLHAGLSGGPLMDRTDVQFVTDGKRTYMFTELDGRAVRKTPEPNGAGYTEEWFDYIAIAKYQLPAR